MRSTFNIRFFIKREKLKANGGAPIFCRITIDGKEACFGTKTDVDPSSHSEKSSNAALFYGVERCLFRRFYTSEIGCGA